MKTLIRMLLLASLSTSAWADVVVMANGDRITGTVDSIAGGKVLINTEYAGAVAVDLDAVVSLDTDAAFEVRIGDEHLKGAFQSTAAGVALDGQVIALSDVRSAVENQLALGDFGSDWTSRADIGLVISNGNSDTESLNSLIESTLTRGRSEHSFSLLISNEEAEEETTKDQTDFDYGYKRFLDEQWFFAANAEYFQDRLKDIDHPISAGAGIGYQFWDNSLGSLSIEAGVSAVREEVDGMEDDNPAFRWALEWKRYLLAKKLEVFHKHSLLIIPDDDSGEVLSASTGLRYAVSDRIDTTARIDLNHETEPAPGNSRSDVTYTLGVGIKF